MAVRNPSSSTMGALAIDGVNFLNKKDGGGGGAKLPFAGARKAGGGMDEEEVGFTGDLLSNIPKSVGNMDALIKRVVYTNLSKGQNDSDRVAYKNNMGDIPTLLKKSIFRKFKNSQPAAVAIRKDKAKARKATKVAELKDLNQDPKQVIHELMVQTNHELNRVRDFNIEGNWKNTLFFNPKNFSLFYNLGEGKHQGASGFNKGITTGTGKRQFAILRSAHRLLNAIRNYRTYINRKPMTQKQFDGKITSYISGVTFPIYRFGEEQVIKRGAENAEQATRKLGTRMLGQLTNRVEFGKNAITEYAPINVMEKYLRENAGGQ